ncbi:MAG: MFS transporter [Acidobacteriia bacterium]|nr:MFS transporter [Terriglobia bacterium]
MTKGVPAKQGYRLPGNVWILGWVAFFNDTATEMGYWLLPQFLVVVLGAQPMAFGLIEGAAETVSSFSRLLSGWLSDRLRRRKPLAAAGYTLANLVKPLLAVAQSWGQVFWIRFVDRAAKGVRAAPRDALIADSVDPAHRGAAFGLRQAMDTAGAIVGPLSAIVLLPLFAGKVRDVFWVAAIPGLASILLAWFAVKEVRPPAKTVVISTSSAGSADKAPGARLGLILAAVGLFSLGNSSDLFLVLRAQNLGLSAWMAPALGLLFNVVYTALSWPAGKLSDRVPRRRLIVAGYLIYAAVYAGFALLHTPQMVWFLFAVYGSYYALTEGVIKAWVADLVPSASRASVFGVLNWVVGVAAFPASLLAGWIWQHYSPAAPFALSSLLAFLAALLLLFA